MVKLWINTIFAPPAACGPMCHRVQHEVDSIGRAEALARLAKKQRNRQRGQRGR